MKEASKFLGREIRRTGTTPMTMFTIYKNPSDFPGKFVVRQFFIGRGGELRAAEQPTAVADSYDEARLALPAGLVAIERHPSDDPVIVETWL